MTHPMIWKVAGSMAATAAGVAARKMLDRSWTVVRDRPPPRNVARSGVDWREALLWGATTAAVVAAARLLARGATGELERRVTGTAPEP